MKLLKISELLLHFLLEVRMPLYYFFGAGLELAKTIVDCTNIKDYCTD